MSLVPGLKTKQPLTLVSGANLYTGFRAAYRDQTLVLTGTSADPWHLTVSRGNVATADLALGATADVVRAALLALAPINGRGGVLVTGDGSGGSPYTFAWQGDLARTMNEVLGVVTPAGVVPTLDRLPFDWTAWTAEWVVALRDPADPDGYGTALLTITDATDPTTLGQVRLGFVPPAVPGGTWPPLAPTNGNVVLWVPAGTVSDVVTAIGAGAADHVLYATHGNLTIPLLAGPIIAQKEPA